MNKESSMIKNIDEKSLTVPQVFDWMSERSGKLTAIVDQELSITYEELKERSEAVSVGLLLHGVRSGDRVGLMMENSVEWIVSALAVARIGAILVPVNTRYRKHEIIHLIDQTSPQVFILCEKFGQNDLVEVFYEACPELVNCDAGFPLRLQRFPSIKHIFCRGIESHAGMKTFSGLSDLKKNRTEALRDFASCQPRPEDILYILFTSGTTSLPKGVMLTHKAVCSTGFKIARRMGILDSDRLWAPVPFFFSFGCITILMSAIWSGASIVLQRYINCPMDCIKGIADNLCSVIYGVPRIYLPMLLEPRLQREDLTCIRTGLVMGSSEQIVKLMRAFGNWNIHSGYGLTETCALSALTSPDDQLEARLCSAGRALEGVTITIKSFESGELLQKGCDGEICIKGDNVTLGYWNDVESTEKAFDADGFFHTGDMGTMTNEGYLFFKGRYKDVYKTGGINVSPVEVEMFLETLPGIEEAAIVGVPDEVWDEVGFAFVKVSQGTEYSEDDIMKFCKGKIASYKIPRVIKFVSEFPRTSSGKVQKCKLRNEALCYRKT